jgi:hypothetical protein
MTDRLWLDGYSGQSTDDLIALDGAYRSDSLVLVFEAAILAKAERLGYGGLSDAELTVVAVEALEREVNNDGFVGLFTNVPEVVPFLVSSLRAIGQLIVADLTARAIRVLAIVGPLTPEAVASAIAADDGGRDDRLHDCDQAYFELAGDLAEPLLAYIKAHRHAITLP